MQYFLKIVIIISFMGCNNSVDESDLVLYNGKYCTSDKSPYTGRVVYRFKSNEIKSVCVFKNGLPQSGKNYDHALELISVDTFYPVQFKEFIDLPAIRRVVLVHSMEGDFSYFSVLFVVQDNALFFSEKTKEDICDIIFDAIVLSQFMPKYFVGMNLKNRLHMKILKGEYDKPLFVKNY